MTDLRTYYTSAGSPAQKSEAPANDNLNTFMQMNPATGFLAFEIFSDSPVTGRLPIPNARITISKRLNGENYFFYRNLTTDASGEATPVSLPTVSREVSLRPGGGRAFATYHVSVEAPGFQRRDVYDVQIFEGITSVLRLPMRQGAGNAVPGAEQTELFRSEG